MARMEARKPDFELLRHGGAIASSAIIYFSSSLDKTATARNCYIFVIFLSQSREAAMRYAAVALFSLMFVAPVLAKCPNLKSGGHCHPDRVFVGRSVVISPNGAYATGPGYNYYAYGPACLRYGYPPNCAYWELPDWNGGMEIRNPGGG